MRKVPSTTIWGVQAIQHTLKVSTLGQYSYNISESAAVSTVPGWTHNCFCIEQETSSAARIGSDAAGMDKQHYGLLLNLLVANLSVRPVVLYSWPEVLEQGG